jgi:hypothetical protein
MTMCCFLLEGCCCWWCWPWPSDELAGVGHMLIQAQCLHRICYMLSHLLVLFWGRARRPIWMCMRQAVERQR